MVWAGLIFVSFYLQGPDGCLMALAILMCGSVVPKVLNLLCQLKCSIAYGAIYHITEGII